MIFDMTKRKGGGGSTETWGLLETINITEPVHYAMYDIPQKALDGKVLLVEFDNVAHTNDYLYVMHGTGESLPTTVAQAYFNKSSITTKNVQIIYVPPNFFSGVTTNGAFVTSGVDRDCNRQTTSATANLFFSMYEASSVLTSGTIRIYGRLT